MFKVLIDISKGVTIAFVVKDYTGARLLAEAANYIEGVLCVQIVKEIK